ncbi:hypothetical protein BH11MYX3_BH11MYX3_40800 [soil metagenome]
MHIATNPHTGGADRRRYGVLMSSMLSSMKRDWKAFKHDAPGTRFVAQNGRLQKRGTAAKVGLAIAGTVLLLGGVVLLFIPGPGLLVIVFGLALLAGLSSRLARTLDRAEPPLRQHAKQMRRGWHHLQIVERLGVFALSLGGLGAVGLGAFGLIS